MINFVFQRVCMMVLIVCSCKMMEPVTLLQVDSPLKINQDEIHSKLTNDKKYDKIPAEKIKQTQKPFANSHITFFNESDNPNNEQNLMVQAFIRSSNSLFKGETDALDEKSIELGEIAEYWRPKSRLQKLPIECREITRTENGIKQIKRFSRAIKHFPFIKSRALARWIEEKNGQRNKSLPKYRISRSGYDSFLRRWHTAKQKHEKPNYRFLSTNQLHKRNRRLTKTKIPTISHFIERNHLKEIPPSHLEEMPLHLVQTLSGVSKEKELINPFSIFPRTRSDKMKTRIKWLIKRQDDECWDQMRRIHCKKRITIKPKKSVNDGKTAKIGFPSTHRCLKGTCPCSVRFEKCSPRTTCPPQPSVCIKSTFGRCQGVDWRAPTPPGDDMCPRGIKGATRRSRVGWVKKVNKRCACDCGCGCSSNLQRAHAGHSDLRGPCGCGCGCGCASGESGHWNLHDNRRHNT